jgi:type IV pilus assembly protein PilF
MSRTGILLATFVGLGLLGIAPATALAESKSEQRAQAALANTDLAIAYMREGDLASAREKIEKALQQNSHNAKTQMTAGFVYDQLKQTRKAQDHFEQAVRLGKDDPLVLNNAAVYFCRTGKYKRGEELLLEAAESPLYKTPDAAFVNAGRCAKSDGRPKDAETHFRRALASNPKQPDALLMMAELAESNGNHLQARAFLERYLSVGPQTASTLWLGRSIEIGLGDTAQAGRYAQRLRDEFPTSPEAGKLFDEEHLSRP